jgi:hypothetical protein
MLIILFNKEKTKEKGRDWSQWFKDIKEQGWWRWECETKDILVGLKTFSEGIK